MQKICRLIALFIASLAIFGMCAPASAGLKELTSWQPAGPDFDCRAKGLSKTERTICTQPQTYASVTEESRDVEADVDDEAAWLRERDHCNTVACLERAYERSARS